MSEYTVQGMCPCQVQSLTIISLIKLSQSLFFPFMYRYVLTLQEFTNLKKIILILYAV
jgi:hypothetical protein